MTSGPCPVPVKHSKKMLRGTSDLSLLQTPGLRLWGKAFLEGRGGEGRSGRGLQTGPVCTEDGLSGTRVPTIWETEGAPCVPRKAWSICDGQGGHDQVTVQTWSCEGVRSILVSHKRSHDTDINIPVSQITSPRVSPRWDPNQVTVQTWNHSCFS